MAQHAIGKMTVKMYTTDYPDTKSFPMLSVVVGQSGK